MSWPDIVIGAILLIVTLKGYKRGFIMELSGAVALLLSIITPWLYNGSFDPALQHLLHITRGSAHVVGMILIGIATYIAVLILARILSAIAKLPVLGLGNALAGAGVGCLKGAFGVWLLLYVALFFPLSPEVRADLHRSVLVGYITRPNKAIDAKLSQALPSFARPFAAPMFARHRV